jgi:hypothetical protein
MKKAAALPGAGHTGAVSSGSNTLLSTFTNLLVTVPPPGKAETTRFLPLIIYKMMSSLASFKKHPG